MNNLPERIRPTIQSLGFVRVAAAVPRTYVGDVLRNAAEAAVLAEQASSQGVEILVFPELNLTGYTAKDLFSQTQLLRDAPDGLEKFLERTKDHRMVCIVGLPLMSGNVLYNAAAICCRGKVLQYVFKRHIPNYKEFEEARWFSSPVLLGEEDQRQILTLNPPRREFSPVLGVEICEDLWLPIPPSSELALAGANVICNLSASNDLVGKADYRRDLVRQQSARCVCGYVYCSAGVYESTADVVFGGHCIIAENGNILAESKRFARASQLITADIDVERLQRERLQMNTFAQQSQEWQRLRPVEKSELDLMLNLSVDLNRKVDPHPFVPSDPAVLDARCQEVFDIATAGLATRLEAVRNATGSQTAVINVSGGLDSTLALIDLVKTYDLLGWDRRDIMALTLPSFGTSAATHGNALILMREFGVTIKEIDISDLSLEVLRLIGHDPDLHCLTCQNVQARLRTLIGMSHGFLIGTGDLSEIALGWCTFNGDHISMYNPNCSVPKTLVRHIISWVAKKQMFGDKISAILKAILATPISPELEPPDAAGRITQITEDLIGPYELHDFFLFNLVRHGFGPSKIFYLACQAFDGRYEPQLILYWLRGFYGRFFASQFKRDVAADGPKVGTVSLSPRGDWRLPSDAFVPSSWVAELGQIEKDLLRASKPKRGKKK